MGRNSWRAKMATWPKWGLPEWLRWLPGHDGNNQKWQSWLQGRIGDYQSGPDGYMAKMRTTRVAHIATWPKRRLSEWPRWLHGQDGGLPEWPGWLPGHDGNYQSGPDGYMAKMGTTREA